MPPLIPQNIFRLLLETYALVEVGGVGGAGPERGRNFEKLFYRICSHCNVRLSEKAGARTVAGQRSASGLAHEVDGATRSADGNTYWELKHLSTPLEKNELLVFNGKALDYLYNSAPLFASVPLHRFLLSGGNIRDECRLFAVQWGIVVVEPSRLPLPLLYEAVQRGFVKTLSRNDIDAVNELAKWSCRPLQTVVQDLAGKLQRSQLPVAARLASRQAKAVVDLQEQIGREVLDTIEDLHPDWINEIAEQLWQRIGGWS